jgi:pimeloyl-ACP methyl ester carboxylesterase
MDSFYIVVPATIALVGVLIAWLSARRILSLRTKNYPMWWKIVEGVALLPVALVALAVAGNSEFDANAYFRSSPPGAMYLVDGHRMRIECTGSGSPTIVLDAGLGNDGLIWGGVQPGLAKTTRICSYDRAGFGWSDPLPMSRDADRIAGELHGLLMAARIDDQVVLMGHSIAGLYIRDYAGRYSASVAGLVFVDGSVPSPGLNPAAARIDAGRASRRIETLLEQAAFYLGLPRLLGACPGSFPGFGRRAAIPMLEGLCHEHFEAYASEWENFDRSGIEAEKADSYVALPILIFSRDTADRAWNQKQEELKKLSTRSRRIIARDSKHYIQLDRSELLERDVSLFIEQIRGKAPAPLDYRSTTTQ